MSDCDCEFRSRVAALYDGELDPPDSNEVERHVETCVACAAELHRLRQVGRMFDAIADEPLSDAAVARIHRAVDQADVEAPLGILRIALVLTALAASVVVIGSAWLWEAPAAGTPIRPTVSIRRSAASDWERVAVTLDPGPLPQTSYDPGDRTRLADLRLTSFMLDGLNHKASHESQ